MSKQTVADIAVPLRGLGLDLEEVSRLRADPARRWERLLTLAAALDDPDACTVLYRILGAMSDPAGRFPGQTRTHSEALADMARTAGRTPDGRGKHRATRANATFAHLVSVVEANRFVPSTGRLRPWAADDVLVLLVVSGWVSALGVPKAAGRVSPAVFEQGVFADSARVRRLAGIGSKDAARLVSAVHKDLGYEGTDSLGSSKRQRAYKGRLQGRTLPKAV